MALKKIIDRIPCLKHRYVESFPADYIPNLKRDTFAIVNTDPSFLAGTHWVMLANKHGKLYYGDSMGLPLTRYCCLNLSNTTATKTNHSTSTPSGVQRQTTRNILQLNFKPLQRANLLCGLYCILFACKLYSGIPLGPINDFNLIKYLYRFM